MAEASYPRSGLAYIVEHSVYIYNEEHDLSVPSVSFQDVQLNESGVKLFVCNYISLFASCQKKTDKDMLHNQILTKIRNY